MWAAQARSCEAAAHVGRKSEVGSGDHGGCGVSVRAVQLIADLGGFRSSYASFLVCRI